MSPRSKRLPILCPNPNHGAEIGDYDHVSGDCGNCGRTIVGCEFCCGVDGEGRRICPECISIRDGFLCAWCMSRLNEQERATRVVEHAGGKLCWHCAAINERMEREIAAKYARQEDAA